RCVCKDARRMLRNKRYLFKDSSWCNARSLRASLRGTKQSHETDLFIGLVTLLREIASLRYAAFAKTRGGCCEISATFSKILRSVSGERRAGIGGTRRSHETGLCIERVTLLREIASLRSA